MSLSEIRKDPIIRRALQIKEAADAAINLERFIAEADMLHSRRASRNLYKIALEPTKLALASLEDLSNRARLSEIKTRIYVQRNAILRAHKHCVSYVGTKYRDTVKEFASNAGDRKLFMDRVLNKLVSSVAEMDDALEILEIYIKDIDQSAWSITRATEMIKLLMDARGKTL